jgi:cytoskeletal protein CcmA (bactofilin family)
MFAKKQKSTEVYADKVSIIAEGLTLSGDIEAEGDIRIDGTVTGNVYCKSKVVIIATGRVIGDIEAINIDVHGYVKGNITTKELLSLKANCRIEGNLRTDRLQIEPNAIFNGQCVMRELPRQTPVVNEDGVLQEEDTFLK